jgi:cell division protein FtsI (penicillin-binding protein 3)
MLRQAFQRETAELLRPVFENVVSDEGTARLAALEEMPIAGKTGTAQKFIDGRYRSRYRASFVGFYPSDKPEYVALVLLDEPSSSIYGGVTAGPIFRNIARRSMALGEKQFAESAPLVQPNPAGEQQMPDVRGLQLSQAQRILGHRNVEYEIQGLGERLGPGDSYVVGQTPEAGEFVSSSDMPVTLQLKHNNASGLTESVTTNELNNTVPDVVGMSMRQAIRILRESGYHINRRGSGTIAAQFPEAGAVMQPGREVLLRGRTPDMNQLTSRDAERAEPVSPPAGEPEETGDEDF